MFIAIHKKFYKLRSVCWSSSNLGKTTGWLGSILNKAKCDTKKVRTIHDLIFIIEFNFSTILNTLYLKRFQVGLSGTSIWSWYFEVRGRKISALRQRFSLYNGTYIKGPTCCHLVPSTQCTRLADKSSWAVDSLSK